MNNLSEMQTNTLQMFWRLVRECHGLPSEDYEISKSDALVLLPRLDRTAGEDEAMSIVRSYPRGALSLLFATISQANLYGYAVSPHAIGLSRIETAKMEAGWFLPISM